MTRSFQHLTAVRLASFKLLRYHGGTRRADVALCYSIDISHCGETGRERKRKREQSSLSDHWQEARTHLSPSHKTEAAHRCLCFFPPMSSTHHVHAYLRTSPPIAKKPAVRAVRPTLSSRTTTSHKLALRGNKSKAKLEHEKERGKHTKEIGEEVDGLGQEGREDMGTSFLQYWYLVTILATFSLVTNIVSIAPCVRNRSSFRAIRFSTAPKGKRRWAGGSKFRLADSLS